MWRKIVIGINRTTENITSLFMIIMVVILFFQIFSRQFFGSSFPWTGDLARYLMIWVIFLGASIAFQQGGHITIDLLADKLSTKYPKLFLHLIVVMLSMIFLSILVITGFQLINQTMTQSATNLNIPMGYVYIIIPLSGILQMINIIDVTARYYKGDVTEEGGKS